MTSNDRTQFFLSNQMEKYEEAAKEYAKKEYGSNFLRVFEEKDFLAGASFAEKEKQVVIDDLYDSIEKYKILVGSLENRLLSANSDIQSSHKREKEAHNAAIEKAIETLNVRVEFGYLDCEWKKIKEELEKLKL